MAADGGEGHYESICRGRRFAGADHHGEGVEVQEGAECSRLVRLVGVDRVQTPVRRLCRPKPDTLVDAETQGQEIGRSGQIVRTSDTRIYSKGPPI